MHRPRALVLSLLIATLAVACGAAVATRDPLADEIARWSDLLAGKTETEGMWAQAKQGNLPVLASAQAALKEGKRLLALQRFSAAKVNLEAVAYLTARSAGQRTEEASFETEWSRMGSVLQADLAAPSPEAFAGVQPAAVRAIGEAALLQVRGYYEASLEYGRSTMPASGLYYLGTAQGQRELAAFTRTLSAPSDRKAPRLHPLAAELDALESELLAAYRPPASIDQHGAFIGASSVLKEARELDAAGLRHGALLRYLQAALQVAKIAPRATGDIAKRLHEHETRLSADGVDHSVGRLFLEIAQADLSANAAPSHPTAAAIADRVLPLYFSALEPARAEPPKPAPQVTVTLVRWPYT